MPALCGGGIQAALLGRDRLGDRPAAKKARAVIEDRRLPWSDAILGLGETHPFAVACARHRRRERPYLHADFALVFGNPVPAADAQGFDGERTAGSDHDPPLL